MGATGDGHQPYRARRDVRPVQLSRHQQRVALRVPDSGGVPARAVSVLRVGDRASALLCSNSAPRPGSSLARRIRRSAWCRRGIELHLRASGRALDGHRAGRAGQPEPAAFSRRFRDVTGRSPYQFVKELKLKRARELLVEGRLGVADVCRAIGYASASHFIKEFRIRFGTTPRDYADAHSVGSRLRAVRAGAV